MVRSRHVAGCGRPVLHSGRRWVIYGIASAATCAPPGCGSPWPSLAPLATFGDRRQGEARDGSTRRRMSVDRVLTRVRGRWLRPVIWRRYWMKLYKVSALAAVSILAFAACSSGSSGSAAPSAAGSGAAASGAVANNKDKVCANKVGKSSTEIHVYSSLPLEGTSLPQSTSIVNEIKALLDGQKVGNFTIKYTEPRRRLGRQERRLGRRGRAGERQHGRQRPRRDGLHRHLQLGRSEAVDPDPERRLPGDVQPGQQLPRSDQGRGRRDHAGRAGFLLPERLPQLRS